MSEELSSSSRKSRLPIIAAAVVVLVIGGTIYWFSIPKNDQPHELETVDELEAQQIEQFYVGVASLEVEENQRAVEIFERLSKSLPNEPAVWANLTVARLRVNEMPAAEASAKRAAELAPANDRIVVLQALVEWSSGRIESAIDLLESVDQPETATLYELSELLQRTGKPESDRQRLAVYAQILERSPENLVVLLEHGRLAARLEDQSTLQPTLDKLARFQAAWSDPIHERFQRVTEALEKQDFRNTATELAFLQNLSKPEAAYQQSLIELGLSSRSIGTPYREFLSLDRSDTIVSESDPKLRFVIEAAKEITEQPEMFLSFPSSGERDSTLVSLAGDELRIGSTALLRFSDPFRKEDSSTLGLRVVQAIDLNSDFQEDIICIGDNGLSIVLQKNKNEFEQFAPNEEQRSLLGQPGTATWPIDFEADGDLDLLISTPGASTRLLQNNGDMTFSEIAAFPEISSPRELLWMDFDRDGDGDVLTLDDAGKVFISWNERGGKYAPPEEIEFDGEAVAIAAGDVDQDGTFDVVLLNNAGGVFRLFVGEAQRQWESIELLTWQDAPDLSAAFREQRVGLYLADLDNNGGIDITASAGNSTAVWLNDLKQPMRRLDGVPDLFVTSVTDCTGNGRLDLVGMRDDAGVIAMNEGEKDYHWQTILARANPNPGDNRINNFGIGGRIGLRAGLLYQSAPITSGRTHFGLGTHSRAGLARIVWPNGTVQAEFDLSADQYVTAQQRLKGSCPFVFARRGDEFVFVKDFIWRSPLGLKINSQETAGITQTEDRIKIPGEFLTVNDGCYEIRITADLWETHFFDHISLLVVDHPDSSEMYIDERFMPASKPDLSSQLVSRPRPVQNARDEQGRNVDGMLQSSDGVYLDTFPLGRFQGVAEEHWVEFDLDEAVPQDGSLLLIGEGWIYPTDSSLNVAMSEGNFPRPRGLALDVLDREGNWLPVSSNLGFPAGKRKTVLLPVPPAALADGQRHFRLRTNLEVYWDYLGWTVTRAEDELKITPVNTVAAELRYRGFSELSELDRRRPDEPVYHRISGTAQRWQDLEGYYTRFGDVRELLREVDDRYVIMNAGDEMVLKFEVPPDLPAGWKRDFVLIGDGWVKDGDYNTAFSRTVHPLPSHSTPEPSSGFPSLFDDPVYQAHPDDWRIFHTRYVTPSHFHQTLQPVSRIQRVRGGLR